MLLPTGNRTVTLFSRDRSDQTDRGTIRRMGTRPLLGFLALCGLLSLASCQRPATEKSQNTLPFQGQTIRVAVPKGWGFKDLWDVQLEEWTARTGARAELAEVDMTDGAGPLLKADAAPQLILFPWTRRGELLADRQLLAFPQDSLVESQLDWEDVFRGLREKQSQIDVGPALVPISSPVLVCYYRSDLLEKAGLKPPETWEDYQTLLDQLPTWAPGLTAVEPWSPEFRATMFLARAVPYVKSSGHYSIFFNVEDGEPFIASPGFVKALEVTQAALKKLAPEVLTYAPDTCRNLVVSGKAALAIGLEIGPGSKVFTPAATVPNADAAATTVQRADAITIGFSRLPGAAKVYDTSLKDWVAGENQAANFVTFTGFAGLCAGVPSSTKPEQAAAALNLLSSLMLYEGAAFPPGAKSLCRESQALDAAAWTGKDLAAAEAGKYIAAAAKSLRDRQQVSELPVVGHVEFRAALTSGLTSCLEQGKAPAEALNSIAADWKELLKKLGPEVVLSSYRSALGLTRRGTIEQLDPP